MKDSMQDFLKRKAMLFFLAIGAFAALGILKEEASAAEPFKLGVQEKGYIEQSPMQGYADYPAPTMIPQQGRMGTSPPLKGGAQSNMMKGGASTGALQGGVGAAAPKPPMQMGIQRVVLPPQFMGLWNVQGARVKVEALPEFQAGAERAFTMNNSQMWEISGDVNVGYSMGSSTGIKTPMTVDKVQGSTAFIRYQHPVGNTMAQEAIVMTLVPGGAQFNGLERVSIVKEGLAQPRARVTYQLVGTRQR